MSEGNIQEFNFLENLKSLLNIKDDKLDTILQLNIDMTIQSVLNYCNISELPSELNYVVCLITAETYKELNSKFESGNVVGNISSISEGGRTVSFTNGSEFKIAVEDKISRMTELNRYRKLYRL